MKDIVIIANFCRDFSKNDNGRFMYLCKELSKENKVEIITSDFNHEMKKQKEPLVHNWPFEITFLHEPGYKKNISIQRFLSHHAWGKKVDNYLKKRKKPDVIYCAVPSLTAPLKAAKYCEQHHIKFIIDIQDLWPEAFLMALNIPVISPLIFFPFKCIANGSYKRADEVVAVSNTYIQRALSVNSKCKEGHNVFLGTKLETFDEGRREEPASKKLEDEFWVGYCGSLSDSYDISNLIKSIKILMDRGISGLKLIIMGSGIYKEKFEKEAENTGINSFFTGKIEYGRMCATLAQCDIVVNPIKHGSAASIINKHGDYAASGLPVINSQENVEYRELVDEYHMGFNCKNEDAEDMANKINILIMNRDLRLEMGQNARRCAEEKFDRRVTYRKLIMTILG